MSDMSTDTLTETKPIRKKGPRLDLPTVLRELQQGKSDKEISVVMGCTEGAVGVFRRKHRLCYKHLEAFKSLRADVLTHTQSRLLEHMTEKKMSKTSIRDLTVSLGVLSNAERLERGQSTSNVSIQKIDTDLEALDKEIARLEKKIDNKTEKKITDVEIIKADPITENATDKALMPIPEKKLEVEEVKNPEGRSKIMLARLERWKKLRSEK